MSRRSSGALGHRQSECLRRMKLNGALWKPGCGWYVDGGQAAETYRILHSLRDRGLVVSVPGTGTYILTEVGERRAQMLLDIDRENAKEDYPCWTFKNDRGNETLRRCASCGWGRLYHHDNTRKPND